MVSGKPTKNKNFKHGKSFNLILVLLCLMLIFLGKLDLIAIRNFKAFLSDFLAPITYAFNKPVKEIASVFEEVKSTGFLRDENIRLKSEIRKLKVLNSRAASNELELLKLRELLKSIPKKMLIIGAGYIGLEMGSVWSRLGSEVHVIEFMDHITPGIDKEISQEFMKILKKQGIKFHMQHKVEKIQKKK